MSSMAMFEAILRADAEEIRRLAADIAIRDATLEDGTTPLMSAACTGDVAIFKLLLELGADVNAEDIGGRNAFLWAAAEGHVNVVQAVLTADDTQIVTATKSGNTALHRAAAYGHPAVIVALLKAGADIDCVNEDGATALCRTCRWGHVDAASLLLRCGADLALADRSGRTPASWCRAKGMDDVLAVLRNTMPVQDELASTANIERVASLLSGEPRDCGAVQGDTAGGWDGEGDAPGPLRVEGWMAKQGHIIRNWKNRWFILDGRRMFYFAKEGATRPKGVIRMVKGTEVMVEERYAKPYCFTLVTPAKKYILQSASEEEQAEWIEAIQLNLELVDAEEALAGGDAEGMEED